MSAEERRAAVERRRRIAAEKRDRSLAASRTRREQSLAASRARREANRARQADRSARARAGREIALVDLVDRLLDGGVVIHGDITLAVADVDLLYVGLRALVASVETVERQYGVRPSARSPALGAGSH